MKFSSTVALALAPLTMAAKVRNSYPAKAIRHEPYMNFDVRSGHDSQSDNSQGGNSQGGNSQGGNGGNSNHGSDKGNGMSKGSKGSGVSANSLTEIIVIWANPGGGAATTTVNQKVTITQTVTDASGAQATQAAAGGASHTVTVGGTAGKVFTPPELDNIPVGDTVIFEFGTMNHTVTQSAFDTPCEALAGGMDSGFMPNPNNTVVPPPQVAMQVVSAKPLWFYCRQKGHCGSGMVFSVNPTADKTQAQFQAAAIAQNGTGADSGITGGSTTSVAGAGGSSTTVSVATASTVDSSSQATNSVSSDQSGSGGSGSGGASTGSGTVNSDGSCACFVSCSAGSFPAADAQGLGARGGIAGSLSMNMGSIS